MPPGLKRRGRRLVHAAVRAEHSGHMHDLGELSRQLCELLQSHDGAAAGSGQRCELDGGRWIGWHFQTWQQRWLLGVGCATDLLEPRRRERLEEALLRVGHASRWGRQQAGMGADHEIELVNCDSPRWSMQLTPAAVQAQCQRLLDQLDALAAGRAEVVASGSGDEGPLHAPACGCARAFSARMRALDASRPPGSIAAQELLFDDHLPLRISLHPRSHHWVLEAFVWDAAPLDAALRRALVAALLYINAAVRDGRALVCSLDGADRVVVISRWHEDGAAQAPQLDWLDYSLRQARRIGGVCAAIALQEAPPYGAPGSWA